MRVLCIPSSKHGYVVRLNKALRAAGVEVDEAPYPYLRWPRNFLGFSMKLLGDYDVCHIHWNVFDFRPIARLFFRTRIPKLWTVHNITPHDPVFKDDLSVTHLYLDNAKVAVWHSARSISEASRSFAAKGLPERWAANDVVIPCMNFNGEFEDTSTEKEARTRLGIGKKEFVVGHYAPTHPYKGTEDFLKLLPMDADRSVRFMVFGECRESGLGAIIQEAAAKRSDMITNLGFISNSEMQHWFKACDIIVQPYREITTSGSIYFAIAFKKPVVAPPLGNIPDVIQHGVTGWLASSPEQVWGCIEEARQDPTAARAMGERAHDFVARTANIEAIAASYIRAYEQAMKS